MSNVEKCGLAKSTGFSETLISAFDMMPHIEPDGSAWIRIVHHNNPGAARFASSDSFTTRVYYDSDRWFNASVLNQITNNTYELMVIQAPTSGASEVKYRWIQTTNPMGNATFDSTKSASVTKITTSGYSTDSRYGGCYTLKANTYLCCNNGTSGNWFGAFGCWNIWNNGLPGYGGTAITTGYMDLYVRIDNQTFTPPTAKIANEYIQSDIFYEI